MEKWILSAFADEHSSDLAGQIAALQSFGIGQIELRFLDGQNISQLTPSQARAAKALLDDGGIRVSAIGSPLGKINLADDFEAHLELSRQVFENAGILDTDKIRMFSFYLRPGETRSQCKGEVLDKLGAMLDLADSFGVKLCHENEGNIWGESPAQCLELMEAFGGRLRTVFDMGNYALQGHTPWPDGYELLKDYIAYFHIKDGFPDGAIVPAGMGQAHIREILHAHSAYTGAPVLLSLEPHLEVFDGYSTLVDHKLNNRYQFPSKAAAFAEAVARTRELL